MLWNRQSRLSKIFSLNKRFGILTLPLFQHLIIPILIETNHLTMDQIPKKNRIMIIAGETSGDQHGAKLVSAMQKRNNGLVFCGIGGRALKETGVDILFDASEISVVGITEVFSKIADILKCLRIVKKTLRTAPPDLLILVDFADFNLHVATTAKKNNIPILYYISPKIWAWRSTTDCTCTRCELRMRTLQI